MNNTDPTDKLAAELESAWLDMEELIVSLDVLEEESLVESGKVRADELNDREFMQLIEEELESRIHLSVKPYYEKVQGQISAIDSLINIDLESPVRFTEKKSAELMKTLTQGWERLQNRIFKSAGLKSQKSVEKLVAVLEEFSKVLQGNITYLREYKEKLDAEFR